MKSRDFVYWLNGYFELVGPNALLTKEQCDIVKKHLAMVYLHEIDPSFGKDQEVLDRVHNGPVVDPKTKQYKPTINPFSPDRKITC